MENTGIKEFSATKFKTSDDKIFDDKQEALKWQQYLDDKRDGKYSFVVTLQYCSGGYDNIVGAFDLEEDAKSYIDKITEKEDINYTGLSPNHYSLVEVLKNPKLEE